MGVERRAELPPRVDRGGAALDGVVRSRPVDGLAVLRLPGFDRDEGVRIRSDGLRDGLARCTPPAGAREVPAVPVERVVLRTPEVGLVRAPVLVREAVVRPDPPDVTLCAPLRDVAVRDDVARLDVAPSRPVVLRGLAEAVLLAVRRGFSLNVVASGETTATVRP